MVSDLSLFACVGARRCVLDSEWDLDGPRLLSSFCFELFGIKSEKTKLQSELFILICRILIIFLLPQINKSVMMQIAGFLKAPHVYSIFETTGDIFCDFFLDNKSFPKRETILKKRICSGGANSFL